MATGLLKEDNIKLLQGIVRIRNRVTHDYYDREIEIKTVVNTAITYGKQLVGIVNRFEEYFLKVIIKGLVTQSFNFTF